MAAESASGEYECFKYIFAAEKFRTLLKYITRHPLQSKLNNKRNGYLEKWRINDGYGQNIVDELK